MKSNIKSGEVERGGGQKQMKTGGRLKLPTKTRSNNGRGGGFSYTSAGMTTAYKKGRGPVHVKEHGPN